MITGDGMIDYNEFVTMMMAKVCFRQFVDLQTLISSKRKCACGRSGIAWVVV